MGFWSDETGPVRTLGYGMVLWNDDGMIVNKLRETAVMVHQFDRQCDRVLQQHAWFKDAAEQHRDKQVSNEAEAAAAAAVAAAAASSSLLSSSSSASSAAAAAKH